MQVNIISAKKNPLLKRKEVNFRVEQGLKAKTPTRSAVRKALATELKTNEKTVFVKKMRTMTGTNISVGIATAYETEEQAKLIEPEYIIKRNKPHEKTEGEETEENG